MSNYQTDTPARVTGPVSVGVLWGATAVSFLFVAGRVLSRLYAFRRLWLNDAFAINVWLMLLGQAIAWQTQVDTLYLMFWVSSGRITQTLEVSHRMAARAVNVATQKGCRSATAISTKQVLSLFGLSYTTSTYSKMTIAPMSKKLKRDIARRTRRPLY
ncbi:hypothetical protein BDV10DRAFT_188736 [Aspergillus recurvatus]